MTKKECIYNYNGFNYHYLIAKSKNAKCNPIVALSGAFQNINTWNRYLDYYTQFSTVILIDVPGSGKSDILPNYYDLEFIAISVYDLFQHLNIKKAELLAASYGTPIGIIFANKYPNLLSHLALIGTMKRFPNHMIKKVENTFVRIYNNEMDKFANEVLNIIMNIEEKDKTRKYRAVRRVLFKILTELNNDDRSKYIENTKRLIYHKEIDYKYIFESPVLVFTGENDYFTKPEYCKEIALLFKNSVYTTIKNSDHLCNIEQYNYTNNLITSFFTNKLTGNIEGCNDIEYNS
ncbi:alpha/beta fold hydrolase [Bacteroidota bacterium]